MRMTGTGRVRVRALQHRERVRPRRGRRKLTTLQPFQPAEVRLKPDTTSEDRDGLASTKRRSREGGHNWGTWSPIAVPAQESVSKFLQKPALFVPQPHNLALVFGPNLDPRFAPPCNRRRGKRLMSANLAGGAYKEGWRLRGFLSISSRVRRISRLESRRRR